MACRLFSNIGVDVIPRSHFINIDEILPLFRIHVDGKVSNISQRRICFEFSKTESRKNFKFDTFLSQLQGGWGAIVSKNSNWINI